MGKPFELDNQVQFEQDIEQNTQEVEMPIGANEIAKAKDTLKKYKSGKATLERRIIANEQWWKLRQWDYIKPDKNNGFKYNQTKDPFEIATPWLWNCIVSKHADIMDGYPESNIKPRTADDVTEAEKLTAILPVEFRNMRYEETYSDITLYALKHGGAVAGIFFNGQKNNGLGAVEVKKIDILNIFWEPGITDIQDSRNVFYTKLVDNEELKEQYPQLEGKQLGDKTIEVNKYVYDDTIDTTDKSLVVDWYYKKYQNGKKVLHYCKFCGDEVLFSTENDPENYPNGWYDHGKYPFEVVSLFDIEGSLIGYGYTDIGRGDQQAIDILTNAMLKNAKATATPRYMVKNDGGINENEFMDYDKPLIHLEGSLDESNIRQVQSSTLSGNIISLREELINEQKETTGNRDVSNGGTTSGVTAASAIVAMQESGSKISRLHNKIFYLFHEHVTYDCIEIIKQYYDLLREYRIEDGKNYEFVKYNNEGLKPQPMDELNGEVRYRDVVFDIEVSAEKESPYKKIEQNELAIQLYNLGVFNAQNSQQALALLQFMDFKNKDNAINIVKENVNTQQTIQSLCNLSMQMAQMIGDPNVIAQLNQILPMLGEQGNTPVPTTDQSVDLDTTKENAQVKNARAMAQESTQVR